MPQLVLTGNNGPLTLAAGDVAAIRDGDIEPHGITVTGAGAYTVTIRESGAGWLLISTTAPVTVGFTK